MNATHPLAQIFAAVDAILLDFDGPICSVFADYNAPLITREMRQLADQLTDDDADELHQATGPHHLLTLAAEHTPHITGQLERYLQTAEIKAVETATPTPGAHDFLHAAHNAGYTLAIVSNNTEECITKYLQQHQLAQLIEHVQGRDPHHPQLMKPHPYLLTTTLDHLNIPPTRAVFIGDQPTDITAAHNAGTHAIGYANKEGKTKALRDAGADYIGMSMAGIKHF